MMGENFSFSYLATGQIQAFHACACLTPCLGPSEVLSIIKAIPCSFVLFIYQLDKLSLFPQLPSIIRHSKLLQRKKLLILIFKWKINKKLPVHSRCETWLLFQQSVVLKHWVKFKKFTQNPVCIYIYIWLHIFCDTDCISDLINMAHQPFPVLHYMFLHSAPMIRFKILNNLLMESWDTRCSYMVYSQKDMNLLHLHSKSIKTSVCLGTKTRLRIAQHPITAYLCLLVAQVDQSNFAYMVMHRNTSNPKLSRGMQASHQVLQTLIFSICCREGPLVLN